MQRGVKCAPKKEIDKWRQDKMLLLYVVQNEVDFTAGGRTFLYEQIMKGI